VAESPQPDQHLPEVSVEDEKTNFFTGSEHFAWFESTPTKNRLNFLSLLQGGAPSYVLNAQALQYMQEQKLPKGPWEQLKNSTTRVFEGTDNGKRIYAPLTSPLSAISALPRKAPYWERYAKEA
jgi:hypothetical protein